MRARPALHISLKRRTAFSATGVPKPQQYRGYWLKYGAKT